MKKNIIAFLMIVSVVFVHADDNYRLIRITNESLQESVDKETCNGYYRSIKQCAVVAGTLVTVYTLWQLQTYFKNIENHTQNNISHNSGPVDIQEGVSLKDSIMKNVENVMKVFGSAQEKTKLFQPAQASGEAQSISWGEIPSFWFGQICKIPSAAVDQTVGFAHGIGKWVADSAPYCIGSGIFACGSGYLKNEWTEYADLQELSGFIKNKTKLWQLCHLLKEFAVPFDIYSQRLSVDINFGHRKVMMEEFMKDVLDSIGAQNQLMQRKLFSVMQKDYLDRSASLAQLQDFALDAIAQRQRVENGDFTLVSELIESNRIQIVSLSNVLITEVERVAAFMQIKMNQQVHSYFLNQEYIDNLVAKTNKFASMIESKLDSSLSDLYEDSRNGNGLFDIIFDFTKQLELFNASAQYM